MGLRPGALHGFYKLTATGGDSFYVAIVLKKNTSPIGGGVFISGANTSSYQEFVANIYYYNQTDMPDTAIVSMALANSGGQTHVGSFFIVDDLSFGKATGVHENSSVVPSTYALSQNFPNPFNPVTTIEFSLPRSGRTTLTILNVLGEEVARLVDNEVQAGNHIVQWNASAVPSGMYFYQLRSGNFLQTMKLLLLK